MLAAMTAREDPRSADAAHDSSSAQSSSAEANTAVERSDRRDGNVAAEAIRRALTLNASGNTGYGLLLLGIKFEIKQNSRKY
mmetsp:Transcript_18776/g.51746  ORF Transcript_18776/g.51746 Transcript_18776/m.51746 type:complete len:82 (-) Transcript_18776:5-250(-)